MALTTNVTSITLSGTSVVEHEGNTVKAVTMSATA